MQQSNSVSAAPKAGIELHGLDNAVLTEADIVLKVNNVGFDSLVPLSQIQTQADKDRYGAQGYSAILTESEFHQVLPGVDTSKVWLTPSLGRPLLYYNPDTLATACYLEHALLPGKQTPSAVEQLIQHMEVAVAKKDFRGSIQALPEAMRMEYFNLLLEKYPDDIQNIPGLFRLFLGNYLSVSYGFDRIRPETFRTIMALRPPEQAQTVQEELAGFPNPIRIYRGGGSGVSLPPEKAFSWTTSIQEALFFAGRLGPQSGYVATATVPKDKVIYSLMNSGEKEVIVFPEDVHIEDTLHLSSLEELQAVIQNAVPMYHYYRDMLTGLEFALDSDQHGRLHTARVLLLTLTVAELLRLPASDRHILSLAAIYHDTQRDNDGEDRVHGKYSAEYYRRNTKNVDPIVSFLIEYHCRPDEEGYAAIRASRKLSKNRTRVTRLFDVFKDADALDRVRFGLTDLNLNQLRNPEAKTLPLFAMQCVEYIEI